ncbi:MAG: hypothetical protein H0U10_03020 [Chloroflexia bacterium]|nr:hypothetical protein [Chloroflexia bacterium]
MKTHSLVRCSVAALTIGLFGGVQAGGAQDEQDSVGNEFGVGLYLGNCDSLVAGAALFDLGDAELETDDFSMSDENEGEGEGEGEGTDLEGQLEEESGGDETDVESAIGSEDEEGEEDEDTESSDSEVVVQGDVIPVYVSETDGFEANLADLVDAPFAIAIRESAQDEAESEGDDSENGEDFVACGEFGGAVAGDRIIIPLRGLGDGGFGGIAILSSGEDEGQSTASVYLFGESTGSGGGEGEGAEGEGAEGEQAEGEGAEGEEAEGEEAEGEGESSALDDILTPQADGTPTS